ncbi:DUF1127 domain-containing protein [Pseudooceanicola sp. C21-150M6]|uniref:DUF1127 domain-containing protein n=1 Tax=Pseudooceanicola sp. C21-150M6 TaxID=3434355 RepID=UPI003D7FAB13
MSTVLRSTAPSFSLRPGQLIAATFSLLALSRSRAQLAQLDGAALEDIGVSLDQAKREASRPVWDVPCNWLR